MSETQYDLETRWITEAGIPGVNRRYGDLVRFKSGKNTQREGVVIALLRTDPEPFYVVEFPEGSSGGAVETEIEFVRNTGRKLTIMPPGVLPFGS